MSKITREGVRIPETKCKWTLDSDPDGNENWSTDCGNMFVFTNGGIKENEFVYCPYCGGIIEEANP